MSNLVTTKPDVQETPTSKATQTAQIGSELPVGINGFAAWMLGVGSIIGSYAWLIQGPMISRAGGAACVTAWILAAITTIPLVMILMELSSMFPTAGGPYVYKYYAVKRLIPNMGDLVGFLTGWLFWVCMIVGLACMSNGLANLLSTCLWGLAKASPLWFGPVVIVTLFGASTLLNLQRVHVAARLNNVFTVMKILMALSFAALVLLAPHSSVTNILAGFVPAGNPNFVSRVLSVFMLALSGFVGVELVACTSSETTTAKKTVPMAMVLTLVTVTLIYAGMCAAIAAASPYVLSPDHTTIVVPNTMIQGTVPAIAGLIGGAFWGRLLTACVVLSIVGCGFAALLATARVAYSMAKTGVFPAQFGTLDTRTRVPKYSLIFQFWCLIIVGVAANLLSRTGAFADAYAFLGEVFGFMYAFVAMIYGFCLVSLRYTDPHLERPYRLGGKSTAVAWILSIFVAAIWGYTAFATIQWTTQLAGTIIILAGIPIYLVHKRQAKHEA